MIKAIIFDMDGLMIDSERLYFAVERELAGQFGKTVEDSTLWKMMGRSPLESIKIYIEDLALDIAPQKLLDMRNEMMNIRMQNDLVPMKGLFELLDHFEKKLTLAIATGAPQKFMDITLDTLDIRNFFTVLQSSDNINHGKPHPEIYLKTIEQLSLHPEECIVLEDSSNGAMAGKNAGCYVIAVPSEYTSGQDFSFVNYVAKDLIDVKTEICRML